MKLKGVVNQIQIKKIILYSAIVFLAGCASLATRRTGTVTSEPSGAYVYIYEETTNRRFEIGTAPRPYWVAQGIYNLWLVAEHPDRKTERWLIPRQGPIDHHFILEAKIPKFARKETQKEKSSYSKGHLSPHLSSSEKRFPNEPEDFRGIRWGTNIKEIPNMIPYPKTEDYMSCYRRKGDKMKIGEAKLDDVLYCFYNDRFASILIEYRSYTDFSKLKDTFFQAYGDGSQPNQFMEKYYWFGGEVYIVFDYSEILNKGHIIYYFMPLWSEKERDEKRKAKEAAKDLTSNVSANQIKQGDMVTIIEPGTVARLCPYPNCAQDQHITRIPAGAVLEIEGIMDVKSGILPAVKWFEVTYKGKRGWISIFNTDKAPAVR